MGWGGICQDDEAGKQRGKSNRVTQADRGLNLVSTWQVVVFFEGVYSVRLTRVLGELCWEPGQGRHLRGVCILLKKQTWVLGWLKG